MRIVWIIGLWLCVALMGCEFITPNTSNALSQSQQIEELQKQTQQLEQQTQALDRLAKSVETLTTQSRPGELK